MATQIIFAQGMSRREKVRTEQVFKAQRKLGFNNGIEAALLTIKAALKKARSKDALDTLKGLERAITAQAKVVID